MKITDVRTVVVNAEMRNWIFVKVITDQAGSSAGVKLHSSGRPSCRRCSRGFTPMLIGEDLAISSTSTRNSIAIRFPHGRDWHERHQRPGTGLLGYLRQMLGIPVYRLLGVKSGTGCACTPPRRRGYEGRLPDFRSPTLIDLAMRCGAGLTALKVVFVPYSEPSWASSYVRQFASMFEKLRMAVGDNIDIMIDFHGRTSPPWQSNISTRLRNSVILLRGAGSTWKISASAPGS